MQGKIKVGLQTSGGSYTKIFRKNKKNRPSKHLLDDVEGLELREDSRWARGFAVRSLKQEEDGSPIDMRSVIQDALAMRSLVVIDVVFLVAGLPSIVSARLGFQDLVFGDLTSMLIFIAFEDGSTVWFVDF
ncbi:unnamed protein product, partial [Brassica oleracea var. botrytis]